MPSQAAIYLTRTKPDLRKVFPKAVSDQGLFKRASFFSFELNGSQIRLNVMPGEQVPQHLTGFQNYITGLPNEQIAKSTASRLVMGTRTVLGLATTADFEENGELWGALLRICSAFGGFLFVNGSIVLSDGRPLVGPLAEATESPGQAVAPNEERGDADEDPSPPDPNRVARRAIVMSAVVCRAFIESDAGSDDAERFRTGLTEWLASLGVSQELEPWEAAMLEKPLGNLESAEQINASWLSEGLAVLAWALGRYELPPYDQSVDPKAVADSLKFLQDGAKQLLSEPHLRPAEELEGYNNAVFSLHWRLRQYGLTHEPMDFEEFAKTAWFGPLSLEGLRLVDKDLALGSVPIHKADQQEFAHCQSIAQERHRASNWLGGYQEIYSEVDTST